MKHFFTFRYLVTRLGIALILLLSLSTLSGVAAPQCPPDVIESCTASEPNCTCVHVVLCTRECWNEVCDYWFWIEGTSTCFLF